MTGAINQGNQEDKRNTLHKRMNRKKKVLLAIMITIAVSAIGVVAFFVLVTRQINQIPSMSFEDMLTYTTENNEDAIITVGIVKDGKTSYTVYGENGSILPQTEYIYEIGSLTKTFTAALLFRAVDEGRLRLEDTIDQYLHLPKQAYYPAIRRLLTHTSGYKGWYFEMPMISNFFHGRNDFYNISTQLLLDRIGKLTLDDRDYDFEYSNFGYAVLGAVLAEVYGEDYKTLINQYAAEDLGLENTAVSDGSGNLHHYWEWEEEDAYQSAGALTSDITDMLAYAQMQLQRTPSYFTGMQEQIASIEGDSSSNAAMNIYMEAIGGAWIMDTVNQIIWHNGGTDHYNSYLGFDQERQTAVVVLSNLPPDYRIPATVMGVKLLTGMGD